MDTIRAFVAVPLPEPTLERIAQIQGQLERQVPRASVRWVRRDAIHLTLKFLGDTLTEKLPVIEAALSAVARNAPGCTAAMGGVGCFPNTSRPRVVWAGLEESSGRLAALQAAIEEAMANFGYRPEGRGFTPHLTIGRLQRQASRSDVARVGEVVATAIIDPIGEVPVEHFALIRSILKPSGAEYTTLARFPLRGSERP